jgi:hypothetical protein|tara:strand:- start:325 stop:702 length:378 start_codon:yes stop_codon:yes gene_type:complete
VPSKDIKNYIEGAINDDYTGSILVICAPVKDDGDYDFITEGAVHNAIIPVTKWLNDNEMSAEMRMNYGSPKLETMGAMAFCVNVWIRPKNKKFTKEEEMFFKLKFNDKLPITDLKPHIDKFLSGK